MALNKYHKAGIAGAIMLAVPIVAQFEGLWLKAKPDKLAYGIPTVCYGETEGVKVGDTYTKAQCKDMLAKKLPRYAESVAKCMHNINVSDMTFASYIAITYNIGERAFCHSQIVAKVNAGDIKGSCNAMMQWTHAGGKYVPGLYNRRVKEREMCLEGLTVHPTITDNDPYSCFGAGRYDAMRSGQVCK